MHAHEPLGAPAIVGAPMVHRGRLAMAPRFLVGTLFLATSLAVRVAAAEGAPGEARLEARLMAPCCWTQTLDMHESEARVVPPARDPETAPRGRCARSH